MTATVLALALINIGAAASIVALTGAAAFAPLWVSLVILAAGIATAVVAVNLWRQYLLGFRESRRQRMRVE